MSDNYSMIIAGDMVIDQPYDTSNIKQEVIDLFLNASSNIVNLEAPVTTSASKLLKTGPHLKAEIGSTLQVLKKLKIEVVTLANNHVLDYGGRGLSDTLNFCRENQFKVVGAGMNLEEAQKILYIDSKSGKIAIVNFAENEWASAFDDMPGANPMGIIANVKQIQEAKRNSDFVIVIVHGGNEYYELPSPRVQDQYRFYAEQGASLVVGHHSHCIGGFEIYKSTPIYYSLGNFLFTRKSTYDDWYMGACIEVRFKDKKLDTQFHPLRQEKNNYQLSLLKGEELDMIMKRIDAINKIIGNENALKESWIKFANKRSYDYLNNWSPMSFIGNRYIKALFYKLKIKMTNKKGIANLLNLMRCEAHRELSQEVLSKYLSK